MTQNPKRRQWYVDTSVQKNLVSRLCFYCFASLLFITLPIAIFNSVRDLEQNFFVHIANVYFDHWPLLLTLSFLLPFAINDMLKLSNRFAGPVYRLRRELQRFADTGEMREVHFRDNDFWQDLAVGVNRLTHRIHELERQLAPEEEESTDDSAVVGQAE